MKRDDDLIRDLLIEMETSEEWLFVVDCDEGDQKREYHLKLLGDVGLILFEGYSYRMTALGHDYLAAIRDEGLWQKTKDTVSETGGNATLEIVKALAIGFLKKKIAQHTDIDLG